jgi:hypothetical protein
MRSWLTLGAVADPEPSSGTRPGAPPITDRGSGASNRWDAFLHARFSGCGAGQHLTHSYPVPRDSGS